MEQSVNDSIGEKLFSIIEMPSSLSSSSSSSTLSSSSPPPPHNTQRFSSVASPSGATDTIHEADDESNEHTSTKPANTHATHTSSSTHVVSPHAASPIQHRRPILTRPASMQPRSQPHQPNPRTLRVRRASTQQQLAARTLPAHAQPATLAHATSASSLPFHMELLSDSLLHSRKGRWQLWTGSCFYYLSTVQCIVSLVCEEWITRVRQDKPHLSDTVESKFVLQWVLLSVGTCAGMVGFALLSSLLYHLTFARVAFKRISLCCLAVQLVCMYVSISLYHFDFDADNELDQRYVYGPGYVHHRHPHHHHHASFTPHTHHVCCMVYV